MTRALEVTVRIVDFDGEAVNGFPDLIVSCSYDEDEHDDAFLREEQFDMYKAVKRLVNY